MPASSSSSISSVTWKPSSRSRSRSRRPGRMALRSRPSHLRIAQNLSNARRQAFPAFLFVGELLAAERRERIEARLAILLCHAPFGAYPTGLLHAMQCRVERPLLDPQELIGNSMDVGGNGVAVHRLLPGQGFENQQHQRALQDVVLFGSHLGKTYLAMPNELGDPKPLDGGTLKGLAGFIDSPMIGAT